MPITMNQEIPSLQSIADQLLTLNQAVAAALNARGIQPNKPGLAKTKPGPGDHPIEKAILDGAKTADSAGASMTAIAKAAKVSRAAVWYHAKRLATTGAIRIVSDPEAKHLTYQVVLTDRVVIKGAGA